MTDLVRANLLACLVLIATLGLGACGQPKPPSSGAPSLTVFAAASLTDALGEVVGLYESRTSTRIITNFAASSTLAQQIKAGADADVFISADEKWMDELAASGHIVAGSRQDLLGNSLVLVAPKDKPFSARVASDFDFASSLPGVSRIAVADPLHVPAGRYAKQVMEKLGWWRSLQPRLLPAQDVRAALRLVEIGEADAGIVYSTDAAASGKVTVVAAVPADTHDPIVYPIAMVKREAVNPAAVKLMDFLDGPEAAAIFARHGFRVPSRP